MIPLWLAVLLIMLVYIIGITSAVFFVWRIHLEIKRLVEKTTRGERND